MNGLFEFDQAKALKKAGCDVVFLAADVRSIRRWRKWGMEQKTIEGVPVLACNIPMGRFPDQWRYTAMQYAVKKLYQKAVEKYGEPDIVHAHFYHMGYVGATLQEQFSAPLIVTEHSSQINRSDMHTGIKQHAAFAYARADGVICVSDALAAHLKKYFAVHAECIPNIVDTELFSPSIHKNSDGFDFVCTASLRPIKGLDTMIGAFSNTFGDREDVRLTIFGEGAMRLNLEKLIAKLGLNESVLLMGMQSREVIAEKLKQSDCFVLTSRTETFGVAYIEAMSSGLPVIATKCGGPESFVTEENGVLVDIDSVEQTADAMQYMVNNAGQYDSQAISKKTKAMFSDMAVANQLIAYYQKVIEKTTV